MKTFETVSSIKQLRQECVEPIGFVPTMGYLHEGHLTLARHARIENSIVVVSIFVNPAQFGPREDFDSYPRNVQCDLALLEKENVDIVFMPSVVEMYPPEFNSRVEVDKVTEGLEGASRRGHFKGVTTVMAKLFNIICPDRAYFGQKDAQQILVIKKMVADLNMNLEIVVVPTVREPDGLAMSSRNTYLNPRERHAALILHRALNLAQELWSKGEKSAGELRREMITLIQKESLATIDYVSVADTETLDELNIISQAALVSLAVKIGSTRLIDNAILA
ncbi:pantoate--beta-alanine ligase [Chloroflexota bacterium]